MRISTKVFLAFAVVIVVALVTAGLLTGRFVADAYRGYVRGFQQQQLARLADAAAQTYANTGSWDAAQQAVVQLAAEGVMPGMGQGHGRGMRGQGMGMANAESAAAVSGTPVLVAPGDVLPLAPLADAAAAATLQDAATTVRVPVVVDGVTVADLAVANMMAMGSAELAMLDEVYRAIWWSGVAAAMVALAAGSLLLANLLRPLRRLQGGVRQVAGGDLSARIDVHGRDELGQLAAGFNHMAATLEQQETLRRTMVADIAHELRTPISVIQGNLQAILDGVYPLDMAEVATIHEETRLLARLVSDLHELAQAEAGRLPLDLQPIEVADVLDHVVSAFRSAAAQKDVTLTAAPLADTPAVLADVDRLRQILNNLLGNALRHTPAGGAIRTGTSAEADRVRFFVENDGPGIAPEDLGRIFERFYRADPSRARDAYTSGAGLGLTIVKALVEMQGGDVGVESAREGPTTFWFTLPRYTP
ncbi:MAG: ATP-binding protein [Caldilineaceae bacterium]